MMAWVESAKLTLVTWSSVILLPLRTQPVGVPLPSAASRLVPLSNEELGQKLLGRPWLWARLAVSSSMAAPRNVSLQFICGFAWVLSFLYLVARMGAPIHSEGVNVLRNELCSYGCS